MKIKYLLLLHCILICNYQHASEKTRPISPSSEKAMHKQIENDLNAIISILDPSDLEPSEQTLSQATVIAIAKSKYPGKIWFEDGRIHHCDLDGSNFGKTDVFRKDDLEKLFPEYFPIESEEEPLTNIGVRFATELEAILLGFPGKWGIKVNYDPAEKRFKEFTRKKTLSSQKPRCDSEDD